MAENRGATAFEAVVERLSCRLREIRWPMRTNRVHGTRRCLPGRQPQGSRVSRRAWIGWRCSRRWQKV